MNTFYRIVPVLGLLALSAPGHAAEPAPKQKSPEIISMVIDYSDGVQKHFVAIPFKEKMTVLDALRAAQEHPRGIQFEHRGSGATAFLTRIDDVANEGGGRNWLYRVNGKQADRSFGAHSLAPGDSVLWKFEVYR